jgi:O-antigen ligase
MGEGRPGLSLRLAALDWQFAIALLLTVSLLAPVVVVPDTFFPYVVPRNILSRVSVELAVVVLVAGVVLGAKRLELSGEYVVYALGVFLAAITVSALFSPAPSRSIHGDFERMGGVWAWLHLAFFFVLLRTIRRDHLVWLLHAALGVSVYASVHAILEHVFVSWQRTTGGLTLAGNPGLFAGYALIAIVLALYLANANGRYRWLYLAAAAVDFAALVMTGNRSSVLGILVGAGAATVLLPLTEDRRRRRWIPLALVGGITLLLMTLVALVRTGSDATLSNAVPGVVRRMASTDFAGRDASRAIQWDAALAGFRDRPLVGYGPENHHLAWSAHFDPRIYELGTEIFDRTHNQFLELLATTGLVGTIGFLSIWAALGYSLYRAFRERRVSGSELSLFVGVNVAYAVYLVFWFVDISAAMLWMLVAALVTARSKPAPVIGHSERAISRGVALAAIGVSVLLLAFVLHRQAFAPLRTNVALAKVDSYRGDLNGALEAVREVSASRAPQTSHTAPVLAHFIGLLAHRGEFEAMRRDSTSREHLDRVLRTTLAAFEEELRRDPLNDRLHTSAGAVMMQAADFYDSPAYLERAIMLLERAVELSPRRREQRRLLELANALRNDYG